MPIALQAGLWGLLSGSALLIGAIIGWFADLPQRLIAAIMAFGAGVLISALSFELVDEAWRQGGFPATAIGFVAGAAIFTIANLVIARRGARHRKRSGPHQGDEGGSGAALAVGALLDGIPESIVIGVSLLAGGTVSGVAVIAVFLSNIPEGLSSSAGMKAAGKSAGMVFAMWAGIALASGVAALVGYLVFDNAPPEAIAVVQALAAGAILAMIVDTMVPEAFAETHEFSGLIAVAGFISAFALSKLGGG
jgi:zinc transporter, ZIP family